MTEDATTTAGRSSAKRRLLAIGVGVVFALLLAEGFLRLVGAGASHETSRTLLNQHDESVYYQCYDSDPNGEFQQVPDVTTGRWLLQRNTIPPERLSLDRIGETPWCVEYRNGSEGVRGPAVTPGPVPGRLRVVGVGDSFAHGDGVPERLTLFSQLQRELGDGVEILNCGKSGADMDLDVQVLGWAAAKYRPHRAIVVFIPNDVTLSPELQARQDLVFDLINVRAEQAQAERSPLHALRVYHVIASFFEMRRVTEDTLALYRDTYDPAKNGANLDRFRAQLRNVARISGGNSVLVMYPLMVGFEGGYPLQFVHDRVAEMAEAEGLPVLDLAPAFAGQRTRGLQVHPVDHHPNGKAHAIAAQRIAEWLRTEQPTFLETN